MKITSFFIALLLISSGYNSNACIENLEKEAESKFPAQSQHLDIEEIKNTFSAILKEEARNMFKSVLMHWDLNTLSNPYALVASSSFTRGLICLYVNAVLALKAEDPENAQQGPIFQFIAAPMIPFKSESYTFTELQTIFLPILREEPKALFNDGMSILLAPNSRKPKHSGKVLIDAIRCLYGKCAFALTLPDPVTFQSEAILKLFAFPTHKHIIEQQNTQLASKITLTPCSDCLRRAQQELPQYAFDVFESALPSVVH